MYIPLLSELFLRATASVKIIIYFPSFLFNLHNIICGNTPSVKYIHRTQKLKKKKPHLLISINYRTTKTFFAYRNIIVVDKYDVKVNFKRNILPMLKTNMMKHLLFDSPNKDFRTTFVWVIFYNIKPKLILIILVCLTHKIWYRCLTYKKLKIYNLRVLSRISFYKCKS